MLNVAIVVSDLEQDTITLSDGTISVGVTVLGANSAPIPEIPYELDFSDKLNSMYINPIF